MSYGPDRDGDFPYRQKTVNVESGGMRIISLCDHSCRRALETGSKGANDCIHTFQGICRCAAVMDLPTDSSDVVIREANPRGIPILYENLITDARASSNKHLPVGPVAPRGVILQHDLASGEEVDQMLRSRLGDEMPTE